MEHTRTDIGGMLPETWLSCRGWLMNIDGRRMFYTSVRSTIADVERVALWARQRRRRPRRSRLSAERCRRSPAPECVSYGSATKR
jgi:hypothetical protein